MISAQHQKSAMWMFDRYIGRLLQKHFHSFHLLAEPPALPTDRPVLLLPNHSTWWDGFFVHLLNRKVLQRRLYMMMLENELIKNHFFARVGAYSINPDSIHGIHESIQYTKDLLRGPAQNMVCWYPQGVLLPLQTRPLSFQKGIERLINAWDQSFSIVLLGIRAELLHEQYPHVCMQLELVPQLPSKPLTAASLEAHMTSLLDRMQVQILTGNLGTKIMTGSLSINRKREKKQGQSK